MMVQMSARSRARGDRAHRGLPRAPPRRRWACRWRGRRCAARPPAAPPEARRPRTPRRGSAPRGPHHGQMNSSSGTASRQFSGRKIAPSRRQANCSSKTSVSFMLSTATRSPRRTPKARPSHSAARHARVELGVGEAPARRQVVRRLRARREARVMGDPVLDRNTRRHAFPLLFIGRASNRHRTLSIMPRVEGLQIKKSASMAGSARPYSRIAVSPGCTFARFSRKISGRATSDTSIISLKSSA